MYPGGVARAPVTDENPGGVAVLVIVVFAVLGVLAVWGRNWTSPEEKERIRREDAALPWRERALNFVPGEPRWINVLLLVVTVVAVIGLVTYRLVAG